MPSDPCRELPRSQFEGFFAALHSLRYVVVGPTLRDGAIIYDEIASPNELPEGWTDKQEPGKYRLEKRGDRALFGYTVGPHSWKKYLFPPERRLWSAAKRGKKIELKAEPLPQKRYAFLGVRACELAAIAIQDKVFLEGESVDPYYAQVRRQSLVIAVNCGQGGGTCFCVSMNAGPRATAGFDIVLTEVLTSEKHSFYVQTGSPKGEAVAEKLEALSAPKDHEATIQKIVDTAAGQMGRRLETEGIRDLLMTNLTHPRWDEVAAKCLACANCTLACPTCFCSTVEEKSDLTGEHAERWKKWDSCFNLDHSYIHGGAVRVSTQSRYRQWMTHKLATWHDQFDTTGCVGCGRCLTWCPVGIDLTEEANYIRQHPAPKEVLKEAHD